MAKAPRAGRVKTRLSPPLTPEQASDLNICMLRDTAQCLSTIAQNMHATPVVSYTPVGDESLFLGILPHGFCLIPQRGNDFGERLLHTAQDLLTCGFSSVCLIDSDSPTVPEAAYRQAIQALARPGERLILGPTADGGYYLIGLKHPEPQLFQDVPWSTGEVYSHTVRRAEHLNLEIVELPLWYDVDDASTLSLLRTELMAGIAPGFATAPGYPAPHTRALLSAMEALPSATLAEPEAGGAADLPLEAAQRPLPTTIPPGGSAQ